MTEATKHDAAALGKPTGRTGAPVRVLVTVGTDHHQFDRLMTWIEAWIAANPSAAQVTVQHGYSRLPRGAEGFSMCSPADLLALNRECDVVVTQGGPGGVMDSLDGGIRPIVVARLVALDEVVDDHQVSFARHMSGVGLVTLASTAEELCAELSAAVACPDSVRVVRDKSHVAAAVAQVGDLIEQLVAQKPRRPARRAAAR